MDYDQLSKDEQRRYRLHGFVGGYDEQQAYLQDLEKSKLQSGALAAIAQIKDTIARQQQGGITQQETNAVANSPAPAQQPPAQEQPAATPSPQPTLASMAALSPRQLATNAGLFDKYSQVPEARAFGAEIDRQEKEQAAKAEAAQKSEREADNSQVLMGAINAMESDEKMASNPMLGVLKALSSSPDFQQFSVDLIKSLDKARTDQMATEGEQKYKTGEREAEQTFKTGERQAGETFTAKQNALDRSAQNQRAAAAQENKTQNRPLPQSAITEVNETEAGMKQLDQMMTGIGSTDRALGPWNKLQAMNPWDTSAQGVKQLGAATKQIIGRGLEGGVLRKEDEYKYDMIMPRVGDTRDVLQKKYTQLRGMLDLKRSQTLEGYTRAGYDTSGFGAMPASDIDIRKEPGQRGSAPTQTPAAPKVSTPQPKAPTTGSDRVAALKSKYGIDY